MVTEQKKETGDEESAQCVHILFHFLQLVLIHSFVRVLDNYNLIVQTSNLLLLLTYGKISHPYAR